MLQIISAYLGIFIMGIGEIIFAKIVLNDKIAVNKKMIITILLVATLVNTIGYLYLEEVIKTAIMFIVHIRFKKKTIASIKEYYERRNKE